MSAANVTALVSVVVAVIGLCLAAMQYLDTKRRTESERERLAAQRERLRTAASAARFGVGSADLIVQRAKDKDVTIAELQNLARQLRGGLDQLAKQIETEGDEVASRAQGHLPPHLHNEHTRTGSCYQIDSGYPPGLDLQRALPAA